MLKVLDIARCGSVINIVKSSWSKRYDILPIMLCEELRSDYQFIELDEIDNAEGTVWCHCFHDHKKSIRQTGSIAIKLNNKFYQQELFRDHIKLPRYKIYKNAISLCADMAQWKTPILIASEYGFGGMHFLYYDHSEPPGVIFERFKLQRIRVAEYISDADNISTHLVIANENTFYVAPPSQQYIANRTVYQGATFPYKYSNKLNEVCAKICKVLHNEGYLGLCNLDFIVKGDDIYFCEINPRMGITTPYVACYLKEEYDINLPYLEYYAIVNKALPNIPNHKEPTIKWDVKLHSGDTPRRNTITHLQVRDLFKRLDGKTYYADMQDGRYAEITVGKK